MTMGRGGYHDLGGVDVLEPLDTSDKPMKFWELQIHCLIGKLASRSCMSVDELRRGIEALPAYSVSKRTYYEKWAAAASQILLERQVISRQDLDAALGLQGPEPTVRFKAGDVVRVKEETVPVRVRKPHLRVPGYLFGLAGTVERECMGLAANPEQLAFREDPDKVPLYRVRFAAADIWEGNDPGCKDSVDVEVYQPWLESAPAAALQQQTAKRRKLTHEQPQHHHDHDHDHEHHHDHDHDHSHDHGDHVHEARATVEQNAVDKEGDDSAQRKFPEAFIKVCLDKKLTTAEDLRAAAEQLEARSGSNLGAKLTVKAWTDPAFKAAYLEDAGEAARQLGIAASNWGDQQVKTTQGVQQIEGTVLVAVENTASVHNLIVCTLCSCYPVAILGVSPAWYKSRAYRARSVRMPRAVLEEFGTYLPKDTAIRVHDSTADCRYIVLPVRPQGTEGWTEEQLLSLVSRDSLLGVKVLRSQVPRGDA